MHLHALLTYTIDTGEWSRSRPGERAPGTQRMGERVSTRAGLEAVRKKKSFPAPTENRTPIFQHVISHYSG